jgi:hypothetical protein
MSWGCPSSSSWTSFEAVESIISFGFGVRAVNLSTSNCWKGWAQNIRRYRLFS